MEHEIKIAVAELGVVRTRLEASRATLVHPSAVERNWVLDDEAGTRAAAGELLRVRRYGERSTMTFKGRAAFADGVKSRAEIEVVVDDATTLLALLASLGLTPRRRYEKRREEWRSGTVTVVLDDTPMGCFVELEGPAAALRPLAVALGLDPAAAVTGNYLELWDAFRAAHPGAGPDMLLP